MNEQDIRLLNDYFNGLLSETEAEAVRVRARAEEAFGAEFRLRTDMEDWPRREKARQDLRAQIRGMEGEYFEQKTEQQFSIKINRKYLAAAAVFVALLAVAWLFTRPSGDLYTQYARHAPLALVERGGTDQNLYRAEEAFNQKNYREAYDALTAILQKDPASPTARLYQGICLMELDRAGEALPIFRSIAGGNTALKEEGRWYMALALVKLGNMSEAKNALEGIGEEEAHYEEARRLMEKL